MFALRHIAVWCGSSPRFNVKSLSSVGASRARGRSTSHCGKTLGAGLTMFAEGWDKRRSWFLDRAGCAEPHALQTWERSELDLEALGLDVGCGVETRSDPYNSATWRTSEKRPERTILDSDCDQVSWWSARIRVWRIRLRRRRGFGRDTTSRPDGWGDVIWSRSL